MLRPRLGVMHSILQDRLTIFKRSIYLKQVNYYLIFVIDFKYSTDNNSKNSDYSVMKKSSINKDDSIVMENGILLFGESESKYEHEQDETNTSNVLILIFININLLLSY